MKTPTTLALASLLALAAACGGATEESKHAPPRSDLPERFYLADVPGGVVDVGTAHESAQEGDTVAVRGVVGGSERPFVEGLAAFTLVDPSVDNKCVRESPQCPTPWDYCCADPRALAASSATIEVREDGELLTASPRGFHGLDHLGTVVVQGTVRRDAQGNLTVVATGLHPQP